MEIESIMGTQENKVMSCKMAVQILIGVKLIPIIRRIK